MLPAVATIAPLFIFLNGIKLDLPILGSFNLRQSLLGVALAVISGALPFAIWNLKGYLDTIPKDLEEAAAVDGASQQPDLPAESSCRWRCRPLAVTAFLGFHARLDRVLLRRRRSCAIRKDYTLAYGTEQDGRCLRTDAVVGLRRVRDPVLPARLGRVLLLPALHRGWPGDRRREGLMSRMALANGGCSADAGPDAHGGPSVERRVT